MNDKLLRVLYDTHTELQVVYYKIDYIINLIKKEYVNQNESNYEIELQNENLLRIENILSDKEDIKEVKEIVKNTYDKIKEYLSQAILPDDYYTINDIYIEYYYLLSSGLKVDEINKTFYEEVATRLHNNITIEDYKRRLYDNI